jgi:hypothetical protein
MNDFDVIDLTTRWMTADPLAMNHEAEMLARRSPDRGRHHAKAPLPKSFDRAPAPHQLEQLPAVFEPAELSHC